MQLLELNCPKCGYEAKLLLGTQTPDQTFSDLNEDFAYYRLFRCPVDKLLFSMNVHDREWDGSCPSHKEAKLQQLSEMPTTCPRCGSRLQVSEREIVEHEEEPSTA
jgi:DNA-directed RNA polymerase subunit RPC12/RpoP